MIRKTVIGCILVLLLAIGGILLIQLIPYGRNHSNPPVVKEPAWDSQTTRDLAVRACFDCHSNQTTWPLYSNFAPMSWLVQRDVDEGRRTINFSDWLQNRRTREIGEVILRGSMPPGYYLITHPNARLTDAEKQALAAGLQKTAASSAGQENTASR
jgi:hypothetical protein